MSDMARFSVVVAACKHTRGIGAAGKLPWRLSGDMAFFKQLTRSTVDPLKRNACIMGRKTWDSIPEKFRPLADRVNVVISRTLRKEDLPEAVVLASSLDDALRQLSAGALGESIEGVFVIGGSSVYADALAKPQLCDRVYMTEVVAAPLAEKAACEASNNRVEAPAAGKDEAPGRHGFECDTFFPPMEADAWKVAKASAEQTERGITYRFLSVEPTVRAPPAAAAEHEEMQYLDLVRDVIAHGVSRPDRTGTGTLSKFGASMRFSLRERFPLLTTKSVFWRGVAEELLWFVSGDTSAKTLQDKKIRIWDGNSSREYLDSIGLTEREVGDLGPVYGWQWRHFGAEYKDMHTDYTGQGVDQIAEVIHKLKHNPCDRRIIFSAWNPADLKKMALPPCHMFAQFYVANGELSCQMYQRSADLGLGVPFNIASYALLTCLLAHVTGLKRGEFVHVMGDAHVYSNHVEPLKEQLERAPREFPTLTISDRVKNLEDCTMADLEISGYAPHGKIKMEMAV